MNHIPEGLQALTPYLIVPDGDREIAFLQEAFDAELVMRMERPDGGLMHALLRIADCSLEIGGANDEWQAVQAALHLYVPDSDAAYRRALEAGATSLYEPADRPYGDREAGVVDPAGNRWFLATRVREVDVEELQAEMGKE